MEKAIALLTDFLGAPSFTFKFNYRTEEVTMKKPNNEITRKTRKLSLKTAFDMDSIGENLLRKQH